MLKSRDGCGEDMGRSGCQWRQKGWIVQCVKIGMWEWGIGGMEGDGGKGRLAMNRLMIGL
ncbi:hypothetical protein [Bartonella sp. AP258QHHD]|uniref:hypothetical protein n=1 Tax=Bartonella sp. AP258QHHD TaxID=3243479 RepID=UPI0035CF02B3